MKRSRPAPWLEGQLPISRYVAGREEMPGGNPRGGAEATRKEGLEGCPFPKRRVSREAEFPGRRFFGRTVFRVRKGWAI